MVQGLIRSNMAKHNWKYRRLSRPRERTWDPDALDALYTVTLNSLMMTSQCSWWLHNDDKWKQNHLN